MSFDFSDLVVQDDDECYNYDNFLADSIFDWLKEPENVLSACDAIEEEQQQQQQAKPKPKKYTIIQQAQPQNTGYWKKVSYHRGPYRKKLKLPIIWCHWRHTRTHTIKCWLNSCNTTASSHFTRCI